MRGLKISLVVGLLLVLASGAGWFALRFLRRAEPAPRALAQPPPQAARNPGASAAAFRSLISAQAGQVTAGDIAKLRALLLNRSSESRAALEHGLRSREPFERLVAFRLLLDPEGWSPSLSAAALQDSFVLVRVEAADGLYLSARFPEWDGFLSIAAKNPSTEYEALKPAMRNLRWREIPAGVELLGIGPGIDRFLRELLHRSDAAAFRAEGDLFGAGIAPLDQQPLVRSLHEGFHRPHLRRPPFQGADRTGWH
jgi:hypothetical protein